MACNPEVLREVPLFSLLDNEELAVLAGQVEMTRFAPRQRIYKIGDFGGRAYVVVTGKVRVSTVDEDQQEVVLDEPGNGDFFGFAALLEQTEHQTGAVALEETVCLEVDLHDIGVLLQQKPLAGIDMLTVLGRHFHIAQQLIRGRSVRNPNVVIEGEETTGEKLADAVARFGGSWRFIIIFGVMLLVYTAINQSLGAGAWDPYPFILLNLFLSMLAALQAPVIMNSQNRQDAKDRVRSELDYEVNRKAESEIQGLTRKLNGLAEKLDDVEELVRQRK